MFSRAGVAPLIALTSLSTLTLGCTPGPSSNLSFGPTKAETAAMVGIVAGVVIVPTVLIVKHHNHHNVKGCIVEGPNGLQIQEIQDYQNLYSIDGAPASLKAGELVHVHGNRGPKVKKGEVQTFKVTQIKKNYGACPATPAASSNSH